MTLEAKWEQIKPKDNVKNYSVEGAHIVPIAASARDTNICGVIVQLYWDKILGIEMATVHFKTKKSLN